jgi:hypothetical protein
VDAPEKFVRLARIISSTLKRRDSIRLPQTFLWTPVWCYFISWVFAKMKRARSNNTPHTPIAHGDFFLNKKEESAFPCIYLCMYIEAMDGLKRPAVQLPS